MPFSTACNTPLSNFESHQNYKVCMTSLGIKMCSWKLNDYGDQAPMCNVSLGSLVSLGISYWVLVMLSVPEPRLC